MIDFMAQTFAVSFGNLYDDEKRRVADRVNIKPVTEEEYQILSRLNLLERCSGYFGFDEE